MPIMRVEKDDRVTESPAGWLLGGNVLVPMEPIAFANTVGRTTAWLHGRIEFKHGVWFFVWMNENGGNNFAVPLKEKMRMRRFVS